MRVWRCSSAGYHRQKTAQPLLARPHYPHLHHLSGAALAPATLSPPPQPRLSPDEASSPRPPRPPRPALANHQHPAHHHHSGETVSATTTPPPRHGPGSYGYTTTNSFVNVHFGPELGSSSTSRPLRFPAHNKLQQFPQVSHPPHNFPAPSHAPGPRPSQHKWSQISKYHGQHNQKPIVQPPHSSVMSLDSHIKQTTARPAAVLPTLTPIISRPSISQLGHPGPGPGYGPALTATTFAKTPSIRFAQSAYSPGSVRTVTLPPFVGTLGDDPLFVR